MKHKNRKQVVKSCARIVVDACFIPGTMMGTELTWLYMLQWKREFSALSLGLLSIIFSNIDLPFSTDQLSTVTTTERDI